MNVLTILSLVGIAAATSMTLKERIAWQEKDSKAFFNFEIQQKLDEIPGMIDAAVVETEGWFGVFGITSERIKRAAEGLSIMAGAVTDVWSDFLVNHRTISKVWEQCMKGDCTQLYNHLEIYSYGLGFGLPPLLPSGTLSVLTCGREDFEEVLNEFDLQRSLQPLFDDGRTPKAVKNIVKAFEVRLKSRLQCIDANANLESRKVHGAFTILISTMNARIKTEVKLNNIV